MAEVTTQMIKDLRERTQAGMSDCKKALTECDADMEKAIEYLRKKGIAQAAKKATRIASEGIIANYMHGSRIGVMVEVNCETDFVSRNPDFQVFAREVCMQVAAMSPQYLSSEEIPAAVLEQERSIRLEQAKQQNKPEPVMQKIVRWSDGQVVQRGLPDGPDLDQGSRRQEGYQGLLTDLIGKIGENIKVRRFVRYEVGEGLAKRADDFVEEVKRQAGQG